MVRQSTEEVIHLAYICPTHYWWHPYRKLTMYYYYGMMRYLGYVATKVLRRPPSR